MPKNPEVARVIVRSACFITSMPIHLGHSDKYFILLHGRSRTYRVANLCAGPVGRISYNLYFDCKHVRYVTCDLIKRIYFFFYFKHLSNSGKLAVDSSLDFTIRLNKYIYEKIPL